MQNRIITNDPSGVLSLWQGRFARAKARQSDERARFEERERLYRGIRDMTESAGADRLAERETPHIYNIIAENIEAQIESSVPPVKVTAGRAGNEAKAKKIEHRLNDIILRLPAEELVDLAERTVPIQGGTYWHPEWDETIRTHTTCGDAALAYRHPQNVIPQEGVIEQDDMDYIFLEYAQTRESVERIYGVELEDAGEDDPSARSVVGETEPAEDFVTVRTAYFYNEDGGVGKIVWSGDTLLFYMNDYEVRHITVCRDCGAELSDAAEEETEEKGGLLSRLLGEKKRKRGIVCRSCGGTGWTDKTVETETVRRDVLDAEGNVVVPMGTEVPVYKPRKLPIILQKSISAPNQLLGISDVDMIEDQQKTINLCEKDILDRVVSCGGMVVLPGFTDIRVSEGIRTIRPGNPADADQIRLIDLQFSASQHMAVMQNAYQEARNLVGITDSYQGRYDSSAKSGVAKQASAQQAAGRLQSKRVMKAAAWARIYEYIFKLILAYDDDVRDVFYRDDVCDVTAEKFDRYEFLARDDAGQWYWDDSYRFSCEASLSLASDRETLYGQIFQNYAAGAYGAVGEIDSLIYMWKQLEFLHYPLAGQTLRYMQAQKRKMSASAQLPTALSGEGGTPTVM